MIGFWRISYQRIDLLIRNVSLTDLHLQRDECVCWDGKVPLRTLLTWSNSFGTQEPTNCACVRASSNLSSAISRDVVCLLICSISSFAYQFNAIAWLNVRVWLRLWSSELVCVCIKFEFRRNHISNNICGKFLFSFVWRNLFLTVLCWTKFSLLLLPPPLSFPSSRESLHNKSMIWIMNEQTSEWVSKRVSEEGERIFLIAWLDLIDCHLFDSM